MATTTKCPTCTCVDPENRWYGFRRVECRDPFHDAKPAPPPDWANLDAVAAWLTAIDAAPERNDWIRDALLAAYARGREDAARVAYVRLQQYADYQARRPPAENADAEPRLFSAVFMRDEVTAAIRAGGA